MTGQSKSPRLSDQRPIPADSRLARRPAPSRCTRPGPVEAVTVICLSYGERGESATDIGARRYARLERCQERAPQGGHGGG